MAAVTATAIGAGAAVYGAVQSGEAARNAGNAANKSSQDWLRYTQIQGQKASAAYDQYVPAQQATIDKSIQAQTLNLDRQQRLVASIDPSLIEAGKQTMQLLQGQSAPVLQNLKDQRENQRGKLLDTLRQQLGPGAETSSLGQNQLQKFDMETSNMLSGAQQDYLSKVSGIALGGAQTLGQSLSQVNDQLAKLGSDYGQIGLNKANIINGTTQNSNAAFKSTVDNAGGAYAGQAAQGALWQNIGSGISKVGGMFAPSPSPTTVNNFNGTPGTLGGDLNGSNNLSMPNIGSSYDASQSNYSLGATLGGGGTPKPVGTYAGQRAAGAVPSYLQDNASYWQGK